jgi:phosphoribosyl-AMP cyclohydrolase
MKDFKFNADGLIPAIIQDADSGEVLMLAYMDKVALERTLAEKKTVFYSRSRNKYWV